jgi:hypothetical protein
MPGLKGPELAAIVRDRWPHVRIMLTSGKRPDQGELPQGAEFVSKPFRPSTLAPKLEAIKTTIGLPE